MASCENAFSRSLNQSLKLSNPPKSEIFLSVKQNSNNCVCWIICFFSSKIRLGLDSSISPYLAMILDKTLRIRSSDKPWQAAEILERVSGDIVCCKNLLSDLIPLKFQNK